MVNLKAGLLLTSTPLLKDTYFADTVILLTEYNANGAMGFICNRPFSRVLSDLEEFKHSPPCPLFEGGPVDQEHLFFIHRKPQLIDGGTEINTHVFSGGDFSQTVLGLNNKSITAHDVKLFIGYCGWDAGELEAEIKEGSWTLSAEDNELVFAL